MNVIGHDDEFMQKEMTVLTIFVQRGDKKTRGVLMAEDGNAILRRARCEECAFGFHRG